ncbi:beta-amyrin 28-monooxygenase [Salvia divinorum]|uniref:Beta-amyrin 28-monooxygenase n=1 Tax=Salvia divinorum TaxID=28513 RepID=A0ABD1FPL9_SALDI
MEAIIAYFLPLFLFPISLYLFSIIWRNGSDDRKKLPPGSRGWPVLGENFKFALSPPRNSSEKGCRNTLRRYSKPHWWEREWQRFAAQKATNYSSRTRTNSSPPGCLNR